MMMILLLFLQKQNLIVRSAGVSDATLREISFTQDTIIYIGSGVRSAGRSDDKLRHFHERMVFSKSPQSSRVPQV